MLRSAARGDMFIQVAVETPQNLSAKQRELLEALFAGQASFAGAAQHISGAIKPAMNCRIAKRSSLRKFNLPASAL